MKYTQLCAAKKLSVRREELYAMISYKSVVDEWLSSGELQPCNPGDVVPIYSTREIELQFEKWLMKRRNGPPSPDAECQRRAALSARSGSRQPERCPPATRPL
jgi:hypothetical protein